MYEGDADIPTKHELVAE